MNETLKPWYAIATPHEDIRAGLLNVRSIKERRYNES